MAALYFWVIGLFSKRGLNKIVFYLIHYYDCSIPCIIVKDISYLELCIDIYVGRKCQGYILSKKLYTVPSRQDIPLIRVRCLDKYSATIGNP